MGKYIDADRLKAEIEKVYKSEIAPWLSGVSATSAIYDYVLPLIDSLQKDDTQVDKMLCSQIWWEEQGWMMIPPNATIEGIDSLLKQVREKLQKEQPEVDLEKFTEKIKTFQGRYKHPEIVPIKGAMAFMARMFYQYPNVARQWYDNLPKSTMD